jgi:hypothetical protein
MSSVLEKWIKSNGFDKKNDDISKSHLTYDGHIYYVPSSMEYKFLELYAKDFKNGVPLHYIEQRPKIYKYMIDLDIYDNSRWSDSSVVNTSKKIIETINEFYETDYWGIICRTNKSKIDSSGRVHSGIHIIFPKLFVTDEISVVLRQAILEKIKLMNGYVKPEGLVEGSVEKPVEKPVEKTTGSAAVSLDNGIFPKYIDWETTIDHRIYNANGYTMIGSSKMDTPDRFYLPIYVSDSKGTPRSMYLERILGDYTELMLETSIRYIPDTFDFTNFFGIGPTRTPSWITNEQLLSQTSKVKLKKSAKTCENTNSDVYKIIYEAILKNMPVYKNCHDLIKNIFRYENDKGITENGSILVTTNSKYCNNLGREHKSCGIYFYASRRGICQKCLCPCNTTVGRKNGLCSEYTSQYYPFDTDLTIFLFGPEPKVSSVKTKGFRKDIDDLEELELSKKESKTESVGSKTESKTKKESKKESAEEKEMRELANVIYDLTSHRGLERVCSNPKKESKKSVKSTDKKPKESETESKDKKPKELSKKESKTDKKPKELSKNELKESKKESKTESKEESAEEKEIKELANVILDLTNNRELELKESKESKELEKTDKEQKKGPKIFSKVGKFQPGMTDTSKITKEKNKNLCGTLLKKLKDLETI